jgi:hypothetical protein
LAEDLAEAEMRLGLSLPNALIGALSEVNGWTDDSGVHVYSTLDLPERNATWEIAEYAPGFVAVADDGGGRIALMSSSSENESVYVTDAGDLDPSVFLLAAATFQEWISSGCPFAKQQRTPSVGAHTVVDVYLTQHPPGGLKDLMRIREVFQLPIAVSELKKRASALPCLVVAGITHGLCERSMAQLGSLSKLMRSMPSSAQS